MRSLNWGSVPDWLAAVGSVASLLVIYTGLRREIRLRRADEVSARARQARLISTVAHVRGSGVATIEVFNGSQGPIYDLVVAPALGATDAALTVAAVRGARGRLDGGATAELSVTLDPGVELDARSALVVDIVFTDQDGSRWHRRGSAPPNLV